MKKPREWYIHVPNAKSYLGRDYLSVAYKSERLAYMRGGGRWHDTQEIVHVREVLPKKRKVKR